MKQMISLSSLTAFVYINSDDIFYLSTAFLCCLDSLFYTLSILMGRDIAKLMRMHVGVEI